MELDVMALEQIARVVASDRHEPFFALGGAICGHPPNGAKADEGQAGQGKAGGKIHRAGFTASDLRAGGAGPEAGRGARALEIFHAAPAMQSVRMPPRMKPRPLCSNLPVASKLKIIRRSAKMAVAA